MDLIVKLFSKGFLSCPSSCPSSRLTIPERLLFSYSFLLSYILKSVDSENRLLGLKFGDSIW